MGDDIQPVPANAPQPIDLPKRSNTKWILGGCCGCLVLAIGFWAIVFGGAWFAAAKLTSPAKVEVKTFLAQAAAGDIPAAYAHFTQELKEQQDLEAFKRGAASHPELFAVADDLGYGEQSWENGRVKLRGTFTNKSGATVTFKFDLIEQGGSWKLLAYDLEPGAK